MLAKKSCCQGGDRAGFAIDAFEIAVNCALGLAVSFAVDAFR